MMINHYPLLFSLMSELFSIIWTRSMWRLYFLIERCYKLREPVLLVGETGGGKTTVCQLLSIVTGSRLHTLNCHMYTETSDFLGVGLFYCCVTLISLFLFLSFFFVTCLFLMVSRVFILYGIDQG